MLNLLENIALKANSDSDLWIALGIGHFIPNHNERAIQCFRKAVEINPNDYNAWNKLGAILAHSKLHKDSLNAYKKALELKPDYVRCWSNLGIAYSNLDMYEDSIKSYLTALKVFPNVPHIWSYLKSVLVYANRTDLQHLTYTRSLNELCNAFGV